MTHKGIPDYQRAARYILKDFVAVCIDYYIFIVCSIQWIVLDVVGHLKPKRRHADSLFRCWCR